MQLAEIRHNLTARRNRIFLLMEEVRRLRIQQRLKVRCRVLGARPWTLSPTRQEAAQRPLPTAAAAAARRLRCLSLGQGVWRVF